jgi:hypothetical protein
LLVGQVIASVKPAEHAAVQSSIVKGAANVNSGSPGGHPK